MRRERVERFDGRGLLVVRSWAIRDGLDGEAVRIFWWVLLV